MRLRRISLFQTQVFGKVIFDGRIRTIALDDAAAIESRVEHLRQKRPLDGPTGLGLVAVRALYTQYKTVAQLDWSMVAVTIVLAVVSAVLAGLYPTWRACRVQPATQLKV